MNTAFRKKGFSLIDIVIYIALFGILIGSVTVAVYTLFTSNNRNEAQVLLVEEAHFLEAKISWIISQAQYITLPAVNTSGTTLSTVPSNTSLGNPLTVQLSANNIIFTRGNSARILSNPDITVSNLSFTYASTTGTGASLKSIQISFILSTYTKDGKIITYNVSHMQYIRI